MLLYGPVHVLVDEFVTGIAPGVQGIDDRGSRFRIAERDGDIAQPSLIADSPYRTAFGPGKPGLFGPAKKVRQVNGTQAVARGEVRLACWLRELVPRTKNLAVIATVYSVADQFAKFLRDRAFQFDGQIGYATPCVEFVWSDYRCGRADIKTGPATAAMRFFRSVHRQWKVGV